MKTHSLHLDYILAPGAAGEDRPRFSIEPDAGERHSMQFSATNLRSVDQLRVEWSTDEGMNNDGKNPAAVTLGRLGRAANTPAQQAAARANGKKGGRPVGAKDSKPRVRRAKS